MTYFDWFRLSLGSWLPWESHALWHWCSQSLLAGTASPSWDSQRLSNQSPAVFRQAMSRQRAFRAPQKMGTDMLLMTYNAMVLMLNDVWIFVDVQWLLTTLGCIFQVDDRRLGGSLYQLCSLTFETPPLLGSLGSRSERGTLGYPPASQSFTQTKVCY